VQNELDLVGGAHPHRVHGVLKLLEPWTKVVPELASRPRPVPVERPLTPAFVLQFQYCRDLAERRPEQIDERISFIPLAAPDANPAPPLRCGVEAGSSPGVGLTARLRIQPENCVQVRATS
jgi:hypothetical protein